MMLPPMKPPIEKPVSEPANEKYSSIAEYSAAMKKLGRIPTVRLVHQDTIGKYDPCYCGSGKKYKFCCWKGAMKS